MGYKFYKRFPPPTGTVRRLHPPKSHTSQKEENYHERCRFVSSIKYSMS